MEVSDIYCWPVHRSVMYKVIFYDFGGIIKITADILISWDDNKINLRVLQNNVMKIWNKSCDV